MLIEIRKGWYCSAGFYKNGRCHCGSVVKKCEQRCKCYHRKWPTPEQFREEYGFDYPDNGAVYTHLDGVGRSWESGGTYIIVKHHRGQYKYIACACTPWGKPPSDWRPE